MRDPLLPTYVRSATRRVPRFLRLLCSSRLCPSPIAWKIAVTASLYPLTSHAPSLRVRLPPSPASPNHGSSFLQNLLGEQSYEAICRCARYLLLGFHRLRTVDASGRDDFRPA